MRRAYDVEKADTEGVQRRVSRDCRRCDGKPKVVVAGDVDEPLQVSVSRADEARIHIAEQLERIAARRVAIEAITDEDSE